MRNETELIELLVSRLERLSADSLWAHRASGIRGALLRVLSQKDVENLPSLIEKGFLILENVAKEKR